MKRFTGANRTGVFTFCLTDIVGSTALWERSPDAMERTLEQHDDLVRRVVDAHGGSVIKSKGEGDSTFSVFGSPQAAVLAALQLVATLASWSWPPGGLLVRAGVHTGHGHERAGDWFGPVVNRAARIRALADDSGVLCSTATAVLVRDGMPEGTHLVDVGEHSLLGLRTPERVWAVVGPKLGVPSLTVPAQRPIIETPTTSFVGRAADVDAVLSLVLRHRLVTLVGPAGTGKTRLAREVAARLSMPGSARLVELADVRDPVAVADAVFKAVTINGDVLGQPPSQLADTPVLVVVDNCEHVVDAAAEAVRALLEATAQVRVLATTREALSLRSEVLFAVEPLGLPRRGATRQAEIIAAPAVSLFLDRARAARPGIVLGSTELQVVLEIARVLDGLPLAIELAAAGLASCGLADLASQLTAGVGTLVDHRRDVEPRHGSLQAALDWSHGGASEEEQVVFRRLATFARFRADDAAAVTAGPNERTRTLAILRSLVSKSLLVMEDRDGHGSYRLLQPVRFYAGDRLREANEVDEVEDRHALHTTQSAIADGRRYFADQATVVARLSFASEDINLSLHHLIDTARYSEAVDLIRALALYWFFNDQRAGRRWADRASAGLRQLDDQQRVALRFARGLLHHGGLEIDRSVDDLRAAAEGYQRLGRPRAEAASRFWLGRAQVFAGRSAADYKPMFQTAAALAAGAGDPLLVAWCQLWLSETEWTEAVPPDMAERLTSVVVQAQRAGVRHPIGHACGRLGQYALRQGDYATAKRYCDQAVTIYRELDDRWHLAEQLDTRAQIELAADDILSAAVDVAEATALSLEIGEERGIARAARVLGVYAAATGHVDIAEQLGAAYHGLPERLTDKGGVPYPTPRPDLAAILASPPIDEACRIAQGELFP